MRVLCVDPDYYYYLRKPATPGNVNLIAVRRVRVNHRRWWKTNFRLYECRFTFYPVHCYATYRKSVNEEGTATTVTFPVDSLTLSL